MTPLRKHAHVVGVAGVGMSAVAQTLLHSGYEVSGSDRFLDQGDELDVLKCLAAAGVRLYPQDGTGIIPSTSCVVVSTAIEPDNADIRAANNHDIPILHRARMLAQLAQGRKCVVVTGTSGKTTVTGMTGWVLEQCGFDPTVVNGGVVLDWQAGNNVGNVRFGRSDLWVLEGDESDRSLLEFSPDWAAITNVSKDHFELAETTKLFRQFAGQVKEGVIAGPGVRKTLELRDAIDTNFEPVAGDGSWSFGLSGVDLEVPLIGRHNAENAHVAALLCQQMGVPLDRIRDSLKRFRGIHRRLEKIGEASSIMVVDDYAHNPAKISASWAAVAERARRILGFWRPHGFAPLALMKQELADAFATVMRPDDLLFILPVFYVGGTAEQTITSEDFVKFLIDRGIACSHAPNYESLEDRLLESCRSGDTILGMGARDPELPRFARRLYQRIKNP